MSAPDDDVDKIKFGEPKPDPQCTCDRTGKYPALAANPYDHALDCPVDQMFKGRRTLWCSDCGQAIDVTPLGDRPERCNSCNSDCEWLKQPLNMNCPHVGCTRPGCDGKHEITGPSSRMTKRRSTLSGETNRRKNATMSD